MQDYKTRMAQAWEEDAKTPKKWASSQYAGRVHKAYTTLSKSKGKNALTVHDITKETGIVAPIVIACVWTSTDGKVILRGSRPFSSTILDVYDIICNYQTRYETSPTVREIREDLKISTSTIQSALTVLSALNCIDYLVGRSRTIRVIMQPPSAHALFDQINMAIRVKNKKEKQIQ